jgi:hypothetical protein
MVEGLTLAAHTFTRSVIKRHQTVLRPIMNRPLVTIGDLGRRTGVAVKVVRLQQDMGLIYTRRRTPAGYRIFDEKALCCAKSAAHQRYSPPVSQTAGAERGADPDSSDQYGVVYW